MVTKEQCIAQGGRWDEVNQRCILKKPEEVAIRTKEGATRIQTPETLAADKREIEIRKAGIGAKQLIAEEQAREEQEETLEAERQRLIAEETPQRRSLQPEQAPLEKLPVVGGTISAVVDTVQELVLATVPEGRFKKAFKENLNVATPEELRTLALTEIERKEIEKGLTTSEKFGRLVEGIPVVGSLAAKYAGGLIETPSENVREVKASLLKERRRISNIETNVKLGYLPVETAQEQVGDIENNIQKLESRLKLLINNSPELKFNSDFVNTLETEVLLAKEKLFQAKLNILTGRSQDPTELQILMRLQEEEDELV